MASWSTQLFWLSRREFRSVIRNKGALIAQLCAVTFMYVIIGNIFYQAAEYHDVDGSMESVVFVTTRHFGLITFIAIGSMFGLAQENMLNFPVERPIFLREYAGGTLIFSIHIRWAFLLPEAFMRFLFHRSHFVVVLQ